MKQQGQDVDEGFLKIEGLINWEDGCKQWWGGWYLFPSHCGSQYVVDVYDQKVEIKLSHKYDGDAWKKGYQDEIYYEKRCPMDGDVCFFLK